MKILCVFGQYNYGQESRGTGYEYRHFIPALKNLGHEVAFFDSWDRSAHADFAALNRALLETVRREQPDVLFCVLMLYEIWTETLDLIRSAFPIKVLNWGTDDSWKFDQFTRFIAPHVDLHATTYASAIESARRNGLTNLYRTQWAADSSGLIAPLPARQCRYQVSFVGSAYGNRRQWIELLRARGIAVQCFGHGWQGGVLNEAQLADVIRGSVISLNFADSPVQVSANPRRYSRQLKARTFEVPGCGGFLVTENAEGIDEYYLPDREIVVFDDADDLVDRINYFLGNPAERDRIANAGFRRTAADHVYEKRFAALLQSLPARSAVAASSHDHGFDAVTAEFEKLVQRHRQNFLTRLAGMLLVGPSVLIWGRRRGPRAARRALFECSWRLAGAKVYSASGWPGRIFYHHS